MAAAPKGVWGIDIGQCALKALRVEMQDGRPVATAFDVVEHTKILSQPDANPDDLIREALEKFQSRNSVKGDEVIIGIAGQSGLARFVKLPPVEEKKIAEIVKFEAKQQIPFPLDEVVWDFQKIAGGPVTDGFALETEIGLFAMKKDVIARNLGYYNTAKIEVHGVQMSPLALVNYATYDVLKRGGTTPADGGEELPGGDDAPKGKKRCVVVMDIGTDASNLIITDGEKIIWQRPIPLGGNAFTRALTKELKLTFAKAEHLKRNAAKSPELPQILKALKPVLTDFVGEVQRSLGYFTNTHRDAHVGYMVGLGSAFRLPGLQKYLAEKLTLEVKKPAAFTRLGGEAVVRDPLFQENLLTFPVAYGLCLQGLGEARLRTNLLPVEIRTDRLIRAKKPYAVAAAAGLLLGTGILALGFAGPYKALTSKEIDKGIEAAKGAVTAATAKDAEESGKKSTVGEVTKELKTNNAGADERLNWPRFTEVFSAALPRPGETGNLDPGIWQGNQDAGQKALQWFQERMRSGVSKDQAILDEMPDNPNPKNLAMVNVEAFTARWVDDLPKFYERMDAKVFAPEGQGGFGADIARNMRPDEREPREQDAKRFKPKVPPGGGWVIEVAGYTEHTNGEAFVERALVGNLQRFEEFARASADKVGKYLPDVKDPLVGPAAADAPRRVSHAFVFNIWTDNNPRPNTFYHLTRSPLGEVLGGAAGGVGGGGGGSPYGGGEGGPGPGGPGGRPGPGGPPSGDGTTPAAEAPLAPPGFVPLSATGNAAVAGAAATGGLTKKGEKRRYEFIVLFTWREPLPSEPGTVGTPP